MLYKFCWVWRSLFYLVLVIELFFPSTKYSVKLRTGQFHVYFSQPITCIKWTLPAELNCCVLVRSGDTSVGIETGLQSGKRGTVIRFLTGAGSFSLSKAFRSAVGIQPAFCFNRYPWLFLRGKGKKREADHSLSPNAWPYTSASSVFLHGLHRDTFKPFYARLPWHFRNCRLATLLISWANDDFYGTRFPVSSVTGELPERLSPWSALNGH
jgi:hypothetical protein